MSSAEHSGCSGRGTICFARGESSFGRVFLSLGSSKSAISQNVLGCLVWLQNVSQVKLFLMTKDRLSRFGGICIIRCASPLFRYARWGKREKLVRQFSTWAARRTP